MEAIAEPYIAHVHTTNREIFTESAGRRLEALPLQVGEIFERDQKQCLIRAAVDVGVSPAIAINPA
jgi:hypothetical protein